MKIEIEIPDFIEFYSVDGSDGITSDEIKERFIDNVMDALVQKIYNQYFGSGWNGIKNECQAMTKEHSVEIINKVIENVTNEILKKKQIVSEMPKKSEINTINKEWENYFIDLINKAIAKKFK